jgi:hypothetical protein
MEPRKFAKTISRYESGLLSAREVANSLLHDLITEQELDTAFVSSVDSLPQDVSREFRSLLEKIEEADFHWTPLFLTSSPVPSDPTEYSAQLRQVCGLLGQGRADDGEPRETESRSRKKIGTARASRTIADPD